MKISKIIAVVLLFVVSIPAQSSITENKKTVYFNTADFNLTKSAVCRLNELLEEAANFPDFEIFIEGHTDNRGMDDYNEQLSFNRSQAVKNYLISKGIAVKNIRTDFKGELAPILPNTSQSNMESNRRVEVSLKGYQFESILELEQELNRNNRTISCLDPTQKNIIKGHNGVQIYIPKDVFVNSNGDTIHEKVTVELIESLSFRDFMASGLQTKVDGQLLETGGMLKITVKAENGENLSVAKGKELIVAVPNENRQDGMEIFLSNKGENWSTTGRPITNRVEKISAVEFPVLQSDRTPFPLFKYTVAAPDRPKLPRKVRAPHEPKLRSYKRKIQWYKWNKDEIRSKQDKNYQKAMTRYLLRVEKYKKRKINYENSLVTYHESMKYYGLEMAHWNSLRLIELEEFSKTADYQRVIKKRLSRNEKHKIVFEFKVKQWRAERKRKVEEWGESMDAMGITSEKDLNNYIFNVTDLKWINIDKFIKNDPSESQMVVMKSEDVINEKVHIVFKNIRSMITCKAIAEQNHFEAHNIPKNENAYIFAYKVVACKPMLCYMQLNGSRDYTLKFTESSFVEIKEVLRQLEKVRS